MSTATHRAWLRKIARDTDRKRMKLARDAVRSAREFKRTARARARKACLKARTAFRRWVKAQRAALQKRIAQLRAQLKARIATRRVKLAACCGREERARTRAEADARVLLARAELAELQLARKRERIWSKRDPHAAPIATRADKRGEADHQVEVNLSPDELIVWQRVKGKVRGSDRMSRTEAFQHWLHEHSADVHRILIEHAEREVERAIRDEYKERQRAKSSRSDRELSRYLASELEAVPF
jgi:hypothetical protein